MPAQTGSSQARGVRTLPLKNQGDNMVRYQRLGRVELNVRDLQRSRDFYKDIVGLQSVGDAVDGSAGFRGGSGGLPSVLRAGPGARFPGGGNFFGKEEGAARPRDPP